MPIVLYYWGRSLSQHPLTEVVPSEGLVLQNVPARLNLTVEQHGDMTLNINDVLGAMEAMSTHYLPQRASQSVRLGEVHIIQGYFLQGLMKVIPNGRNGIAEIDIGSVASEGPADICVDRLVSTETT